MPGKVCVQCHDRLALKTTIYCKACLRARRREQYSGDEDARGRICDRCGDRYDGRGVSTLCVPCRGAPDTEKTCTKCGVKFYSHKDKHMRCGVCRRERATYMKSNYRDHYRQVRVDKTFALEPGQFARMLEEQDGKCPICGLVFQILTDVEDMRKGGITVPYVDHDHNCCDFNPSMSHPLCGKCVRQLICRRCNVMLGHAEDSVENLTSAVAYLQRWR